MTLSSKVSGRSSIVLLLCECLTSYISTSPGVQVDPGEVESLVIPAIRHVESRNGQELRGQVRLHEIVNRVLESGRTFDWVSVYGGSIVRVFTSGPSDLLDRCQRRNNPLQQDRSNRHAEDAHDAQIGKVLVTPRLSMCSTIVDWL